MPTARKSSFRMVFCFGAACRNVFLICSHCDRGQRYCSIDCREPARLKQRREANRRNQQSPAGRFNHRANQQAYRMRLARLLQAQKQSVEENVTDHTSAQPPPLQLSPSPSASLVAKAAQTGRSLFFLRLFAVRTAASAKHGGIFCHFCGRQGQFVDSS
jgi:hypothetical protein